MQAKYIDMINSFDRNGLLLSFSLAIANVKDTSDLEKLITEKLKPVIGFSGVSIFTLDRSHNLVENFLIDPNTKLKFHPNYERYLAPRSIGSWQTFKDFSLNSSPFILHQKKFAKSLSPWELKLLVESDIKQVVGFTLQQATEKFGLMFFYLENEVELEKTLMDLLSGIVNQIAIAVSNISHLYQIKKSEQEKDVLLSFSKDMVRVRIKEDLNQILNQYLKKLCNIKDYVISVIHDDKATHGGFIFNPDASYVQTAKFKEAINAKYEINDGVYNVVLNSEEATVFRIDDLVLRDFVPGYISYWHELGIKSVVGIALRFCNDALGVMWLEPAFITSNKIFNSDLFLGITSQLSIALSNIMANVKLEERMQEIIEFKRKLQEETRYLRSEVDLNQNEIIGDSEQIKYVNEIVSQVASVNSSILLLGETGTGKEVVARTIHNSSSRRDKLMIKVNCAALPKDLIESELFGHEKGSFTGAYEKRIGKFELANGSTIFLDEVGEMPLDLQGKLLRILQEREVERIGGHSSIKLDVRVIAATNKDLLKEVESGRFRSDLYYRLNVFPITLPPLRERKQDIKALSLFFLEKFSKKSGKNITSIKEKPLQQLIAYNWPGNVRELEHFIERCVVLSTDSSIKEIPFYTKINMEMTKQIDTDRIVTLDENERAYIISVLRKCGGKVFGAFGAAAKLGIPVSTLNSKIAKLGIIKEKIVRYKERK